METSDAGTPVYTVVYPVKFFTPRQPEQFTAK